MRPIDADALKRYVDCGHLRPPDEICLSELAVVRMIDRMPTIDIVEVIRCKDCKYRVTDINTCDICGSHHKRCGFTSESVPDEHFCGWAERKEDIDNDRLS